MVDHLVAVGAEPGFGARPIVRAVRYRVKSPLARFLLQQGPATEEIRLTVQRGHVVPEALPKGGAPQTAAPKKPKAPKTRLPKASAPRAGRRSPSRNGSSVPSGRPGEDGQHPERD